MIWFLILIIILTSAILLYARRFTSETTIFGFYFVQFYNLVVVMPISALALINIGLDIAKNPEVGNLPLDTNLLLSIFILSVLVGVIATSAHSVATSISQALKEHIFLGAYAMVERIHGSVSHEMLFGAVTTMILFIGLLGVNHPSVTPINPAFPLYAGIIVGLICSLTVLRSTHVHVSLINGFFTSASLIIIVNVLSLPINDYPYVIFALSCSVFIFICLLVSTLIYLKSKRVAKVMSKIIFPKGHSIHQKFSTI